MIEAMACGTPVVGLRRGSLPEVIDHGQSGFVVDDTEQGVTAVNEIHKVARSECRATFDRRFRVERMARDYLKIYHRLAEQAGGPTPTPGNERWKTTSSA
jgi:glycosyltransferase involved in cell wall biosynthesis